MDSLKRHVADRASGQSTREIREIVEILIEEAADFGIECKGNPSSAMRLLALDGLLTQALANAIRAGSAAENDSLLNKIQDLLCDRSPVSADN